MHYRAVLTMIGIAFAAPVTQLASAQDYPNKPLRLVVPWPPGGITDVISRGLAIGLTDALGQQVVVDNRPGAAGTLGIAITAKARPDGHTIMMTDVPSHAISASLYAKLPYDPVKDVEPVALPSRSPMALVVNPRSGLKSAAQLIELARKEAGKFSYASSGPGSITHLTAERFKRDVKIDLLHVPYKGSGPATAAIVGGETGMMFSCIAPAIPHVKAGRLTLLGLTAAARSPVFPETPTIAESIPGFVLGCNTGFFVTGGTPNAIVQRLHNEVMKYVGHAQMKALLAANSSEPAPFTQPQFKSYVAEEMRDWGEIVRAAGLRIE